MLVRNFKKILPYASISLGLFNLVKSYQTPDENKNKLDNIQRLVEEGNALNKTVSDKLNTIDPEIELNKIEGINNISENVNNIRKSLDNLQGEITPNIPTPNFEEITSVNKTLIEQNKIYEDILKFVSKSVGNSGDNSNSFIIDNTLIDSINNFYSNLSIIETLVVIHISGFIAILVSMFSILTIFYGEFFIQKFNLESKFPKLAKFIQLRRKFQQFYLITNFLLILLVILALTFANLLVIGIIKF
jgi:hypothetical protein